MQLLNSIMLLSCELWPLLFLALGAGMWLLGWLFGRSRVSKLREQLDVVTRRNKSLLSENEAVQEDLKIVRSDYDKTNKRLIAAENNLESNTNKLNSALSRTKMIEQERNNISSEKDNLISVRNSLLSEKKNWDVERNKLQENSLDAADANISNKAIADLREKLANSERALAECESSKIKDDKVSFVAPPPPPSSGSDINKLVSDSGEKDLSDRPSISPLVGSVPTGGSESGMGKHFKSNNLQIMEGVGPKIESLLKEAGYHTWEDISNASNADLQKVLDDAGPRYRMHNPAAWSEQAKYASNGQWDRLVQYQKDIDGNASEGSSKAEKLYFKAMGFAAAKPDDLKVVEGIGPKIESLLKNAGVKNWSMLAESDVSRLQDILTSAGDRYRLADPGTWPKQAELAAAGKWTELKEYQDFLSGGKA